MRARRGISIGATSAALLLCGAIGAMAYLMSIGAGAGSLSVATLGSPSPVIATNPTAGVAHVAWSAVSSPSASNPEVTYTVERSGNAGSSWSPANSTCTGTLSQSTNSCNDQPATDGDYIYRVTAHFRTWTSAGVSNSINVVVAVATKLVFTTSPQTTTAGVLSGTITVQRQSAASAPITAGSTTVNLSSTSGAGIFRDTGDTLNITSVTIANGTSTASFKYKDTVAGTPTITAAASGLTSAMQQETVSPAAAASLTLSAVSTTPTAGAANNLTVTAKDSFGNTATGYSGDKTLTFGGASAIGTNNPTVSDKVGTAVNFGTPETINFSSGIATVTGSTNGVMKLYKVETANISVGDGVISNAGNLLSVTVAPGAASKLAITAAVGTQTSGSANSLTITARDAFGNTATGYTGDKSLTFGGAANAPDGTKPTVTNKTGTAIDFGTAEIINFVSGASSVSGSNNGVMNLYKAETANISVTDGTVNNTGNLLSVTVSAGTASKLAWTQVTVSNGTLSTPCLFTCTDTGITNFGTFTARVSVTDAAGNTVTNLGTGHTVTVSTPTSGAGSGGAFTAPTAGTSVTLTIAGTGAADSTATFTFKAQNGSWTSDNFTASTASGTAYLNATATVTK